LAIWVYRRPKAELEQAYIYCTGSPSIDLEFWHPFMGRWHSGSAVWYAAVTASKNKPKGLRLIKSAGYLQAF